MTLQLFSASQVEAVPVGLQVAPVLVVAAMTRMTVLPARAVLWESAVCAFWTPIAAVARCAILVHLAVSS